MREPDELFAQLQKSKFRRRFRLKPDDRAYLKQKTMAVVLQHGRHFLLERLAPAEPVHDGRQTPMRGHPIFIAQHATACCCRGCLAKWHQIPQGRHLSDREIDYLLDILAQWLERQMSPYNEAASEPIPTDEQRWLF